MSLFSSLCGCRSGGALTQTVSQLLGGAACCRFRLLSLSLSLSALEGLLLTGRTSAEQLFQNSSSEALRRVSALLCSSFLRLQHLSLPVCRRQRVKSNSLVFCNPDPPELRQYFLERQTALAQGRRKMNVECGVSTVLPSCWTSKSFPSKTEWKKYNVPLSLSLFILSLPTSLLALSLTRFSFLSQFSH